MAGPEQPEWRRYATKTTSQLLRFAGLNGFWKVCHGGLRDLGWFRSVREGAAVDREGNPIPWMAYPAIEFLESRVQSSFSVFEFGCGNSTMWWAARVAKVASVEHDASWYEKVSRELPANALVVHRELGGGYCEAAAGKGPFDIVVIDGRERNAAARSALEELSPSGVFVWDNSNRSQYAEGIGYLKERGFRKLEFSGMAPINARRSETAILYRPDNCLGL